MTPTEVKRHLAGFLTAYLRGSTFRSGSARASAFVGANDVYGLDRLWAGGARLSFLGITLEGKVGLDELRVLAEVLQTDRIHAYSVVEERETDYGDLRYGAQLRLEAYGATLPPEVDRQLSYLPDVEF